MTFIFGMTLILRKRLGWFVSNMTDDDGIDLLFGLLGGIAVYITFGLMFEMADVGHLMRVANGKVIESGKRTILAWDALEYPYETNTFTGQYLSDENNLKSVYKVYYRVKEEDLGEMQKYYDEVIVKRGNDLSVVHKEAELVVLINLSSKAILSADEIKNAAAGYLGNFGIKVIGVE